MYGKSEEAGQETREMLEYVRRLPIVHIGYIKQLSGRAEVQKVLDDAVGRGKLEAAVGEKTRELCHYGRR
jgi:hypothetical protein